MADLIKKIKIRKENGTYTDYIPIGAEARHIDMKDGDTVEEKMNKKPYYYSTIEDMKNDTKLKSGDLAITLGYYEVNDGGSGEYLIRTKRNEDNIDEKFLIGVSNNLISELIVKDDIVDIRKIGALKINDIHDFVLAIINRNYECYIPEGIWKTSPLQIAKYNSARIKGREIYGNNNSNGTILTPISNQDYIIKVGYDNNTSIANDISIKNIQFNTNGYICVNALLMSRVQFSNFSELGFRKCKCSDSAFRLREVWETRFGRVMFRQTDAPYCMIFGERIGAGNISTNYFEYLSFEGARGNCLKFEENSQYSMCTIDTIDFESGTVAFEDETRVSITSVNNYKKLYIIETGNGKGEISINNLNVNSIAQHAYINNNTGLTRAYDTVIKCNNSDTGYYSFAIGNLSGVGAINKPTLIDANSLDKFHLNNYIFQGGTYFNCYIRGCRIFDYFPLTFANNYLNANFDGAYRDLCVDEARVYCKSASHAVRVANLTCQGDKLYVHAKGTGNINFGGSDHITLSNIENYEWFEIQMIENQIGDNNNLLLGTNTNLEIDNYFFK